MDFSEFILSVLLVMVTTFVPILSAVLFTYLKKKGLVETLKGKELLVQKGIKFAEQAYWDLEGPAKYDVAVRWIADQFNKVNLKFTPDEIRGLIEAAVYNMQQEWETVYDDDDSFVVQ